MTQFNADALKRSLQTRVLGQVVHYWDEVDSTNAALVRLNKEGAIEGTVVIADAQKEGRGRIGKPWFSPPGVNLHVSVLLKPPIHFYEARFFTLIGSLAIADAIAAQGVKAQVKWPNDVLVNDKKIAGVLAEVQAHDGRVAQMILGMGVNLNIDRPSVADIYSQFADSLNDDKKLESFWLGMVEEEKHHAKILAADKATLEVDSDTGYFMREFPAKLAEMDTLLKLIEEKARTGMTKDEAFELVLQLEQSELNTIYPDLELMGRAAVKLMARHMDESLSLPKHQQGLLAGAKRFLPSGEVRQRAEIWATQHHMAQRPGR